MKPALAFTLALFLQAGAAYAHVGLVSEMPADGTTVAVSSALTLTLTFTEMVTLRFSGITLKGPEGKDLPTGVASLSADGVTLTIPAVTTLTAGTYLVDWHALADDGHKSHGSYSFTVK